jgi:hypothetical protein
LQTPAGKALYARRKSTIETVFRIIKAVLEFRQFYLHGLKAAQGEWNLVCVAWNGIFLISFFSVAADSCQMEDIDPEREVDAGNYSLF